MRLKKLFIHGFKSFADKVEMNFEQGVTGVVGPNGCGKSNISDAVRWVLGEQSAKQLRGSKMEDVIFNGTEARRRMGYCEVSLTFENEDHALPIDYTEVCVTRRVYRTGESEYLINGSACRLKDIVDLFRDTGTGRDGYSIIGQGRVGEILSQKTEERRQVFEEAAGIVKYKTRKQEAERRLENTTQNLDRVNDIVKTLEERIEPLRLQSEDARKYLEWREEQKQLELNSFLVRSERYEQRIADISETSAELKHQLEANDSERIAVSEKREETQNILTGSEQETAAKRDEVQLLIQEVESGEGAAGVLRERLASLKRDKERVEKEKQAAEEGESGLDARIEALGIALESKEAELTDEKAAFEIQDNELKKAEEETAALEQAAEDAKEAVINAMNALGDVRSEQARLNTLSQTIDIQLKNLSGSLDENGSETERLTEAKQTAEAALIDEKARLGELVRQAREAQEKAREAGEEYERIGREGQALQAERQESASRLKLLNELQRDYEGYNMSVKNVLLEVRRRNMAGVHGVVANVIHAEERIEKAVETALGAALQNIITDTEEEARELIEYLKRNNYGRATFLPISAVRGRTLEGAERRVLSMDGCIGVASEMVTFDSRYSGIVNSLLGRTVIAENLEKGIPIHRAGHQQFRLVTLDGSVMNVGGSMTGGSLQSRMVSLMSREREIKETGEKLKRYDERLKQLTERIRELSESRAALKADRQEAIDCMHQQEIAVTRAEAHASQADSELAAHVRRCENIESEIQNLELQKTRIAEEIDTLNSRKQSQENSGNEMRQEAARLQKELNAARPRLAEMRRVNTEALVGITALEKDVLSRKTEIARLKGQKGDTARLLEESRKNLETIERDIASDNEKLSESERLLGAMRGKLGTVRTEFEKLDRQRLETQEELKKANEEMDRLTRSTEELSERSHREEMLLQRIQSEFDGLNARIWEDYQLTREGAEEFRDPEFKLSEGDKRINTIKSQIRALGSVNVGAVDEYREVSQRYEELSSQRNDLIAARDDLTGIIAELSDKMEKQFKVQFEQLDIYFRQTFTELFGGGHAQLSLEDPSNALTSGIEIVAQPPGKKLQLLSLLSGGERALTAIAILFAMLKLKPTPFCILDEIEAALDDANIDNFADYLKTYSEKTQFVVVTHRKGTMARCDALYGVAMEEKGVSKMMSVKLGEAE